MRIIPCATLLHAERTVDRLADGERIVQIVERFDEGDFSE